jgi:acetyl-CoA C-acetyltransferase
MNTKLPVIVGVSQICQHEEDPLAALEPLVLMRNALQLAAEDAEAGHLLSLAQSYRVPQGLWGYNNPAAWLAEQFGAANAETVSAELSGTSVQSMLNDAAVEISAGKKEIIVLTGAEAENSSRRARKAGHEPMRTKVQYPEPDRFFKARGEEHGLVDMDAGFRDVATIFALFETAIRHHRGECVADHHKRISRLWARFAAVAKDNPTAWVRNGWDAEFIGTPSTANRWVVNPYTKYLVANMVVDQAAAIIITSTETARRLGVPESKWVYFHVGGEASVTRSVSERMTYYEEPPMKIVGQRVLELAGIEADQLDFIDLYSCFPSAIQLGADALGLSQDRPLTVTGGLTFHGGPLNSYVMHSIAAMVECLRKTPGSKGLVSSVGGAFSKHAHGVFSCQPPLAGFRFADLADEVASLPKRKYVSTYEGKVEIEAYAVQHPDAGGPAHALVACRTPDDSRTWAHVEDPDVLGMLAGEDACGRTAKVGADRMLIP